MIGVLCVSATPRRATATESGDTVKLVSQRMAGATDRIESALEVTGQLKLAPTDPAQETSVVANLFYHERALSLDLSGKTPLRSVRHYDKALASMKVGGGTLGPSLRDSRRLIAVDVAQNKTTVFSPQGPLTREELDLIDIFGNSLLLDRLLPASRVAIGQKWKHSGEVLALLLGLDTVGACDVASTLASVADQTARLELSGRVSGTALGAATQIDVQGKYHFDLRTGRITWFALLVREKRRQSQIEHGFEMLARLQMKITPGADAPALADAALKPLNLQATPEATTLVYESPEAGWRWLHDRRWYVANDDPKRTVFRLVDRGDYLAQCTVAPLDEAAAKEISIEQFQADLQRLLGQSFKQVVRTSEPSNAAEYNIYRVELLGDLDGVAIRWIYYRVAGPEGPPVIYAFTMEDELSQRFGGADATLMSSLELLPRKVAAKPEATAKPQGR